MDVRVCKSAFPSSSGWESTTMTENRFPSSCAFNSTFCTTDDLDNESLQ